MATTSSRSFNQYSGIDRQRQLQTLPSATDRLGDPAATQAVRDVAPWALGLAERVATPQGRSTRDPYRALEMLSRGTARPGQVQAAMGLRQLQMQDQDPVDAIREQQFGIGNNPNNGGGDWSNQNRQDRVSSAISNGSFGGIQQSFNQRGAPFGHSMDNSGNIFRGNGQSPSVTASRGSVFGAQRGGSGWKPRAGGGSTFYP